MRKVLLITSLLLVTAGFVQAQTYTWIGPNNGSWATAGNWITNLKTTHE